MKTLLASGLVLVALGIGGWYFVSQTLLSAADKDVPKSQTKANHAKAKQLLAQSLQRLHVEALAHFHADPQNGFSRMPVVYEKVLKEWQTPYFSPGELEVELPIPFQADMEKIHADSVRDFITHQPAAKDSKKEIPSVIVFGENYDKNKKVWEAKSVDLVGLLKHVHPVVYISEKLPDAHDNCEVKTRPLDDFEHGALAALDKGSNLFSRERDGVIRLMGAIRARTDCLDCHTDKKEGDLLGAMSYTLRAADYQRVPWHKRKLTQE